MERITLTRQELYDLVWKEPLLTLAKKYEITDVGLRKVCLRMDIPVPPMGYWQKIKYGKEVKKIKLPASHSGENRYTLQTREEGNEFRHGEPSPMRLRKTEIETALADKLIVPDHLSHPVKLITEVKKYLLTKDARSYKYKGVVCSHGRLNIRVAPSNVSRALRFMDTFIKAVQHRGHKVEISEGKSYVLIFGQKLEISFKERLKKVVVPDSPWDRTEFHPVGLLYFKVDGRHGKEWSDGKVTVEEQLSNIIAKLEIEAENQNIEDLKWEKWRQEQKEKERVEIEKWERQKAELAAFKTLLADSERWQKVKLMRTYIDEVETMIKNKEDHRTGLDEWISWAKKKINWYDPYIKQADELLEDVDRETLEFKTDPPSHIWE